MRRYLTDDIEWPLEVTEPTVTVSEVKDILNELQLKFSSKGRNQILAILHTYPVDAYNEEHKPVKKERRQELQHMLEETERYLSELFSFSLTDPSPESNDLCLTISNFRESLELRLRCMKIKGQGKDGGPPTKTALACLVQRLILIYKKETKQKISAGYTEEVEWARKGWGRERKEYNPLAIQYLAKLIGLIVSVRKKDIERIVRQSQENLYRPGIDIS
jgi:hypothetical protein